MFISNQITEHKVIGL